MTTKSVNSITSHTVTTTTDVKVIQNAENQLFIAEVAKTFPVLEHSTPVAIQTTVFGSFVEKTMVIKDTTSSTTVQVTTLLNTTSNHITVIDNKTISVNKTEVILHPVTLVNVIPAPLITVTATQIPEINSLISSIKTTTKKEVTLESITIEDFGTVKKLIAVQPTPTAKQQYVYILDKTTQSLELIDTFTVSNTVETLVFEQTTNKYGEKTVISNSVTEIKTVIPEISSGIEFISTKYPAVTVDRIDLIQTVEYPNFYQSKVVVESGTVNEVTIVVNIDKQTKAVT